MADVAVARFSLRWEADFAKGYLDDAGIPARVIDDGSVGLSSYTGDLQGAVVLVAAEDAESARLTLESAGVLESEEAAAARPPPLVERELPPVMRADVRDVTEQLALAKRRTTRHGIYAVLGVTPAALIPLTGLLVQGNGVLVAALCVLVGAREVWRWAQAGREVNRLELLLMELEDEADGDAGPPPFSE